MVSWPLSCAVKLSSVHLITLNSLMLSRALTNAPSFLFYIVHIHLGLCYIATTNDDSVSYGFVDTFSNEDYLHTRIASYSIYEVLHFTA